MEELNENKVIGMILAMTGKMIEIVSRLETNINSFIEKIEDDNKKKYFQENKTFYLVRFAQEELAHKYDGFHMRHDWPMIEQRFSTYFHEKLKDYEEKSKYFKR